ncbi:DUF695 domain-containing protein [Erysipelothrix sp. HDW6C]|uniref:DUF695 domain-containing protein n=1 Tax=Erysipelothrix sp. HDW6C TaxID=2714930 RepID=UPI001407627A|nr:DUF695 domain-containing protein [Erysipelothrix sp. HDW6C]QIK68829.1 DUF695 domain-containing protein [Erysipelothrix sp. HDW6C]
MEPNYQFFPRTVNDMPQSIRVDLNSKHIIDSHPHLIVVVAKYEARENGFPLNEVFAEMNAFEDALTESLLTKDVYHMGAITGNGSIDHYFAASSLDALETYILTNFDKAYSAKSRHNGSKACFEEFLLPDMYEKNYIYNQMVCMNMQDKGERFENPRDVDFYTYFTTKDQADLYAKHFDEFAHTINIEPQENESILVHLIAEIVPSLPFMNGVTDSIVDLIQEYDGDFDGWGSNIIS